MDLKYFLSCQLSKSAAVNGDFILFFLVEPASWNDMETLLQAAVLSLKVK